MKLFCGPYLLAKVESVFWSHGVQNRVVTPSKLNVDNNHNCKIKTNLYTLRTLCAVAHVKADLN